MEHSTPTDEELARRLREGDEEAGRKLFERHLALMRPAARRHLGGPLRRKVGESDLIQSVFVVVTQRLSEFENRGPGSFRQWLRGILDHKMREGLRRYYGTRKRDARREVTLDTQVARKIQARTEGPSTAAARKDDRRALLDSISSLPDDHRRVLRLVHVDGLTFEDAGLSMGRSADATRKLYSRAVAALSETRRGQGDGS